jgi:hypothetical protein
MTDRERWTIYPLLLMSIGMQLRDKVFPSAVFKARAIHCQTLTVGDNANAPRVAVSPNGIVQLFGEDKKPRMMLGTAENKGIMQLLGDDKKPRVVLGVAANDAGVVDVHGADGERRAAMMVDESQQIGSLATFAADGEPRVVIAAGQGAGGIVTIHGPGGRQIAALGMGKPLGGLSTPSTPKTEGEEGQPAENVPPPALGGQLALFSADGKPQWLLTHDERGSGRALAFDDRGHLYLVLMATLNVTPGPPGQAQPGAPPATEGADDHKPEGAADSPEGAPPAELAVEPSAPPAAEPSAPPATEPPADAAPAAPKSPEAGDSAQP